MATRNLDIWQMVLIDMEARRVLGIHKYGTAVYSNNGRDALMDAYEEALDMCVYLRQAIEERNASHSKATSMSAQS